MKLYIANSTEEIDSMSKFSNIQWPFGNFWVNGKNGSNCAIFSNTGRLNTGYQYDWFNPGNIWVNNTKSLGSCSFLTNSGQAKTSNYFFCQYN
jgi:hypothetical protein